MNFNNFHEAMLIFICYLICNMNIYMESYAYSYDFV